MAEQAEHPPRDSAVCATSAPRDNATQLADVPSWERSIALPQSLSLSHLEAGKDSPCDSSHPEGGLANLLDLSGAYGNLVTTYGVVQHIY